MRVGVSVSTPFSEIEMKKMHKLASAVALALGGSAASGQVLYEPFDYGINTATNLSSTSTTGARFSTQGTYWATRGLTNADNLRPQSEVIPAPSYMGGANPVLPPTFGSNVRSRTTGNAEYATLGLGQFFNSAPSELYWSAVIKPNSIPSTTSGVMIAGILSFALPTAPTVGPPPTDGQPGTRQAALWTRQTGTNTYQLGLQQNVNSSTGVVWSPDITGTTNSQFVVAKLNINAGSNNDTMEMWINPTSNFGSTTAAPAANAFAYLTKTSAVDLTDSLPTTPTGSPAHSGFFIRTASGTGNMVFDDIRVDSTWAGVTPDGNKQFTWTGAAAGGNLADATWAKTAGNPDANPNGLGAVANFGTLGVAGTPMDANALITTAGETVDSINIRTPNGINIGGTGVTISSNASAGQIVAYQGNQAVSAPLTLASNVAVKANTNASITLTGAISGTGKTVQKFGQGVVTLGAANLLASDVNLDVRAGSLNLGGFAQQAGTVSLGVSHSNISSGLGGPDLLPATIDGAAGSTISATTFDLRSGSVNVPIAAGNVVKNNAGTVTLNAANTYTGTTTVNSGRLILAGAPVSTVTAALNSSLSGLSQMEVSNDANLGAVPASVVSNNITIAGGGMLRTTATMTLDANRGINMSGTSPGLLSVAPSTTLTYGGDVNGTGGLTQTGGGTLVLTGASSYGGATNVVGGTGTAASVMRIGTDNALPATTTLGLNAIAAGGSATFDMGDASNTGFNQTVAGVANNGTLGTPTITNSGSAIKTLTVNNSASNTINFPITGKVALTKANAGTLTVSGANTYAGDTTVNGGIISVGNSGNLGSSTNGIAFGGGTLQATGALSSASRNVSVTAANGTVDTNGFDVAVGNVDGAGNFTKNGNGNLTANRFRVNDLSVATGTAVTAQISDPASSTAVTAGTSNVNSLNVAGKLNLTNNRIVTNDAQGVVTAGTYGGVQGRVQSGLAGGSGIYTDEPLISTFQTTIGVATAAEAKSLSTGQTTMWSGQTVDTNDTLVMYTWAGDANLDGKVNADDYASIDLYSTIPGESSWNHGDFNYNGVINADDYALIDSNVQNANYSPYWTTDAARAISAGPSAGGSATAGLTAVPEPASVGLLMVSAAGLLGRRRRAK
jgi:autotransporter-associated beta strand protein